MMSSTAGSRSLVSPATARSRAVVVTGHYPDDQAGRNGAQRNPANHGEHRQTETAVNSSTKDESRHTGNRQSREGLVPDVLAHIPAPRCALSRNI
jgi:hypothetical protein